MRSRSVAIWTGIVAALLLAPPPVLAAVTVGFAGGDLASNTSIGHCPDFPPVTSTCTTQCTDVASARFGTDPQLGPPTNTVERPLCAVVEAVGAASVQSEVTGTATKTVSGTQQTVTIELTSSASAQYTLERGEGTAFVHMVTNSDISFLVTGEPEAVAISPSFQVAGSRRDVFVRLEGDTALLGEIAENPSAGTSTDTLPRSIILPPGSYVITAGFATDAVQGPGIGAVFDEPEIAGHLTLTVDLGKPNDEIHWINPGGGDFDVASNWNPQRVPLEDATHSDTALFDLAGSGSPVPILGRDDAVTRLVIRHMNVDLNGPVRVLGSSKNDFLIDEGGTLLLDGGVAFATNGARIGTQGARSRVFVSGRGTRWTSRSGDELLIGDTAPGKVVVEQDGTLDVRNALTVGSTAPGTLRVDSGGRATTPSCTLNEGSIRVSGLGRRRSRLEVASDLDIGRAGGTGSLLIDGGGGVTADRVLVGDAAAGRADVAISGVDSSLNVPSNLRLSGNGAGRLEVKDGGLLVTSGIASIGQNLGIGELLVHGTSGGTPASWDAFGTTTIGSQLLPSSLTVEDSGRVIGTAQLAFGLDLNDLGVGQVSGDGSLLSAVNLVVGADGHGDLTISDGGSALSTSGFVGQSKQAGPVLPPASQASGPGTGVVTIDGNPLAPAEWHVTGNCFVGIDEPGTILLRGVPLLGGATLHVNGRLLNGTHGLIAGFGTLSVGRLVNRGIISPGLSPGDLTIEGDYEQEPGGGVELEVAGPDAVQHDVLDITGDATFAGKADLRFIDGFLPKAGDSFDLLNVGGSESGAFDEVEVTGVAHGFAHQLTMTGGVMRLTAENDAQPERCADPDDGDGDGALECNFLVNPGMEEASATAGRPRAWVASDPTPDRRKCNRGGRVFAHTGLCAYQLVGRPDPAAHELRQAMVGVGGDAGRRLTLAVWARGKKIPAAANPTIQLDLLSAGVVVERLRLTLPGDSYPFTRFARARTARHAYDEARIRIRYGGASGKLWVDDLSLGVE